MRIFPYRHLNALKQHKFYTYRAVFNSSRSIGHASCTCPKKRVCPVLDKKHTVFRVIIKVTGKLVIIR